MTGTGRSADRPGIVPVPPPEERAPVAGRLRFGRIEGIGQPIVRLVLGGGGLGSGALVGDRAMELLDDFVARGGNCLDTAHVYGDGASEAVIGRWLTRRGGCREVVVVTKGAHPPATTPAAVRPQLAESLERLGCDQVDLYLLHRDDPEVPVAEFVDALDEVRTLGWTQAVGVSNWSLERLVAAREDAVRRGRTKPVALSNHVSLAELTRPPFDGGQGVRVSDLGRLADSRVAVLSWSARAHGYFARRGASSARSGRGRGRRTPPGGPGRRSWRPGGGRRPTWSRWRGSSPSPRRRSRSSGAGLRRRRPSCSPHSSSTWMRPKWPFFGTVLASARVRARRSRPHPPRERGGRQPSSKRPPPGLALGRSAGDGQR
jgi:aryl-alcohol dehydrogenase-like predicted oxidoreductase